MDDILLAIGILLVAGGGIVLAFAYRYSESVRREKRRVRDLTRRARSAGLRGLYEFEADRSKWDSTGEFATYEPADGEDRVLYAAVGSRIEGESEFFAKEMLWSTARLAWVGFSALLIGAGICAASVFG